MNMFPPLYDEETVRKKFSKIKVTGLQIRAAMYWLGRLKRGELKDEMTNYDDFKTVILRDLLGYPAAKLDFEKKHVEFSYRDQTETTHVCFECKGTKTELWERQPYGKSEQETPVLQTQSNMQRFTPAALYGVCTNYNEFVLLDNKQGSKCHTISFDEIGDKKKGMDKLREFIGLFSYEELVLEKTLEGLYKISGTRQMKEFTNEFYKLFHETRLMLVEAFRGKLGEDGTRAAITYAQTYLNRLIFIFFAEDRGDIESRLFTKRVVRILENANISSQSKAVSEDIVTLFKQLNKGEKARPPFQEIFGFNGGLFREEIPEKAFFLDLRPPGFFKNVRQNFKFSKDVRLDEPTEKAVKRHGGELSPIIKNLLLMDRFDFMKDIGVNIMGHILEQSISDLEELQGADTKRRKKEGVYYTPEHITEYICNNTIIPYLSERNASTVDVLVSEYGGRLDELEKRLHKIRILDPACGSGAFLIKAAETLVKIDQMIQKQRQTGPKQQTMEEYQYEKEIVRIIENNIFGIDINHEAVITTRLSMFLKMSSGRRKLVDLSKNIQVGNSIISDENIAGYKAYDWENRFPEKFDIVIGNPPFNAEISDDESRFILENYPAAKNNSNSAIAFLNLAKNLLKSGGFLGLVLPKSLMYSQKWAAARDFVIDDLTKIMDVSKAFVGVLLEQVIIILKNDSNVNSYEINSLSGKTDSKVNKKLLKSFGLILNDLNADELSLGQKIICENDFCSKIADIKRGVIIQKYLKNKGDIEILRGKSIGRYKIKPITDFINKDDYKKLRKKIEYLEKPKIIIQNIIAHVKNPKERIIMMAAYDHKGDIALDNVGNIFLKDSSIDPFYLICILNSKLISWYAYNFIYAKAIRTMRFDKFHLSKIPIPIVRNNDYNKVKALGNMIDNEEKKLAEISEKSSEYAKVNSKIEQIDSDIENLVYKIYGITEDERKVIESSV